MKSLLLSTVVVLLITSFISCNQNQSDDALKDVSLEFGQLDDKGHLKSSDKKVIQFNFDNPLKSKSKSLEIKEVTHSVTKEKVTGILLPEGGTNGTPPVEGKIITVRGYVFDYTSNCFIYGSISLDTDTGSQWFTPADLATQSTMNNCNYGNVG